MKKHLYTTSLLFFVLIGSIKAQGYLSFYNLKEYVIQTQDVSPIYLPKNAVTFGTPINLGLNINSNIKLNDLLVENGNQLEIDFDNLTSIADKENTINANINVSIFILGIRTKKGSITLFANAKSNLTSQFSNDFTEVLANGFIDSFALSNEKFEATAYTEIGIGFTQKFLKNKLAIGLRLKSLNGIIHAEFEENSKFAVDINPTNYYWNVMASNATLNTAGINNDSSDTFKLFGDNKGFGMDLGFNYQVNNKLSLDLAINDLGSINWSENVTNYNIKDTTGSVFSGIDLVNNEDIEDALGNVIGTTETNESFKTKIGSKTFLSAKYRVSKKNTLRASYFKNNNQHVNIKPNFSIGYNRDLNKSTYGVTLGSEGFGANFAVQLSFLQLYAAVNDITSIASKIETSKSANVRFGLNFLFGNKKKTKKSETK